MRPSTALLVAGALVVAGTAFASATGVGAATATPTTTPPAETPSPETVAAESGATYERGTVLSFAVDRAGIYEVRSDEDGLVTARQADGGTVVLDTHLLAPGEYRLVHAERDTVAYRFGVRGDDDAPTTTPDAPTSPPAPVVAEPDGSYHVGTDLAIPVGDGTYSVELADGTFVANRSTHDGRVRLDTAGLPAGDYRLVGGGDVAFRFSLYEGTVTPPSVTPPPTGDSRADGTPSVAGAGPDRETSRGTGQGSATDAGTTTRDGTTAKSVPAVGPGATAAAVLALSGVLAARRG